MDKFNRTISVNFIDDATGSIFATTEIPASDLPESFEVETTLHLGEEDWSVASADPSTRAMFEKSGLLTLRLRRVGRIEQVDPKTILYSLPSICDRLAAIGDGPLVGDECILHEDDWRQLEFVSRQLTTDIDAELQSIRLIHEQERLQYGWRKIHARRRPDPPIVAPLTLKDLAWHFAEPIEFKGVSYRDAVSPIVGGYSFTTADGLKCYGTQENGFVTVIAVHEISAESPSRRSADALAGIARQFELDLVNWCRCAIASWDQPLFRELLGTSNAEGK